MSHAADAGRKQLFYRKEKTEYGKYRVLPPRLIKQLATEQSYRYNKNIDNQREAVFSWAGRQSKKERFVSFYLC